MTIEEKLSAIKAINEEKESIEHGISELNKRRAIENNAWAFFKVPVPHDVVKEMDAVLLQYFYIRKAELIAKAEALMK